MSLSVGQRVRVTGSVQAQQHNGKPGSVSGAVDESSGRCCVTLDDGSSLNFKPINLVLEPDPPAISAPLSTATSRGNTEPVTDRMSTWLREEEERVRLNPPPPLWDEVHDNRSIVFSHPQFKDMLRDWQLRAEPHETECPDGLMFHQAAVTADLPFLKAMGRYNANWNAVEKDTGRSDPHRAARAHSGHAVCHVPRRPWVAAATAVAIPYRHAALVPYHVITPAAPRPPCTSYPTLTSAPQ